MAEDNSVVDDERAPWASRRFERKQRRRDAELLRKEGQLAELLGEALAGESPAALGRLAREDQRQAEEGLAALTRNGKTYYKLLEELTEGDMGARIAAARLREAWLKERQDRWLGYGGGPKSGRSPVVESSRSSGCRLFLNASASQDLMLMRGCISMSLSSGFAAIIYYLLSQDNRRE